MIYVGFTIIPLNEQPLKIPILSLCIPLLIFCFSATAQTHNEMHVDLPDETEETSVIDRGQWQIEAAGLFNGYADTTSSTIGQFMLRYGISRKIEMRLLVEDGRNRDHYTEETVQSTYPLAIGLKAAIFEGHGLVPDITIVSYLKLPFTSHSKEQVSYWSPILLAAFENRIGDKWTIGYNVGMQQEAFSSEWVVLTNASVHYKISEPVEVFTEYYAQFSAQQLPMHNAGMGIAWQPSENVELFVSAGSTLDHDPSNYFMNGGLAYRFE